MSLNRARFLLMGIFLVSLMIQLLVFLFLRGSMWPEEFEGVTLKLLGIYSAQLGIILGSIFAQPKAPIAMPSPSLVWSAMLLAAFWNLLLLGRTVAFGIAERDSVTELMKYLDQVGAASSFLVAGALAFFFGKSAHSVASRSNQR